MASTRRRRDGSAGFTLIEVMIAMGILAFGLLNLALMQLQALTQGSQGRHSSDAMSVARSHIEQVNRIPWADLTTAETAGTWVAPAWAGATPTWNSTVTKPASGGGVTEQSYAVTWLVTDVGTAPTCLRDVQVRVSWAEEDFTNNRNLILATRRYNWGATAC